MLALLPLGHAQRAAGLSRDSLHTFRTASRVGHEAGHSFAAVAGLIDLAFDLLDQGNLRESQWLCEEELRRQVDWRGQSLPVAGLVNVPLAAALYHADDLDRALGCARQGLESSRRLLSENVLGSDAQRFLALIYYSRGEVDTAFTLLRTAQQGAEQVRYRRPARVLAATQVDLHLRQGNLAAAEQWIVPLAFCPELPPPPGYESEYCVYARWLRLSGKYDQARQALATVGESVRTGGRFGRLIGIRIGQALVEQACDEMVAACSFMEEAIALAACEGYRSQFLDAGSQVFPLLRLARQAAPAFADDLLLRASAKASLRTSALSSERRPGTAAGTVAESLSASLIEPLTARELEVLNLLASGLAYREIAERLIVALGTVQAHCSNIYGKLGVNNRTQAVLKARELSLLA
jgi:LuxR family maltose regulon positive regulatory protein